MGDSSTPGSKLKAARDVGIDIDRYGKMSLDTTKLESALKNNFSDVVTLFSANTNNQSVYSPLPGGVAGDAVKKIDAMLRSDGAVARQTDTTNALIERQKAELTKLEERMNKLLERYTRQFSAMDSIVSGINGQRTSLESSLKGLMAMYNNN
jgi:flagellar hook-associated protein 2